MRGRGMYLLAKPKNKDFLQASLRIFPSLRAYIGREGSEFFQVPQAIERVRACWGESSEIVSALLSRNFCKSLAYTEGEITKFFQVPESI